MAEQKEKIKLFQESYRKQLIDVWENSVISTHTFLHQDDIIFYKNIVSEIDFNFISTYCLFDVDLMIGFIGVYDSKIEMLFISPDYIGKGYGKELIQFALENLKATEVDVNEQNTNALNFYKRMGFVAYERLETDNEGKNYPIIKMRLKQ